MKVRSRQIWSEDFQPFHSSHAVLNWAWPVSLRTLSSSTDDSFSDYLWRERGSYIGDCFVNLHLTFLLTNDWRTTRRTLINFGLAQREDGQLAGCAPSWLRVPHEDFTLIWILAIHDYWSITGDQSMIADNWEVILKILNRKTWQTGDSRLYDLFNRRQFIDWRVVPSERE